MKIIADENIPLAWEAFSTLGDVKLVKGRHLEPPLDADALIVRSVTKVNAGLLDGSPVQFVGTATIGMDHIDRDYLARQKIGFASAPGSNANSVAEYILSALLTYAEERGFNLEGKSIGVVGVGNVGSRVVAKCTAIGMTVLKNDPPEQEATGDPSFLPLDRVLGADFVTVHVPLTRTGEHPTYHMADESFFGKMNGMFLNSSRGAVVDEAALKQALGKTVHAAVLDVWEHEPEIDHALAVRVSGTPHIAGYSYDGKVNGTRMMYDALCSHFGLTPRWNQADFMPPGPEVTVRGYTDEDVLRNAIRGVYDIRTDYARFRKQMMDFDRLRKQYPVRREFQTADLKLECSLKAIHKLKGAGFVVDL